MAGTFDLRAQLVTDENIPFERLSRVVAAAIEAGFGVIQLRAKHASARVMIMQTQELAAVIDGRASLIVNDRLDVVLAALDRGIRVDGVHLGQDDVPPTTARRLLGEAALIGWTANDPAHLVSVASMPPGTLDYLGVGAVHATLTKPDHPPVLGVEGFAAFAAASPLPCVAIGGITKKDVEPLRAAGAAGVAVVSAVCSASDPWSAAREFTENSVAWA